MYYFTQAGIERSRRFTTQEEAEHNAMLVMQAHNPRVTVRVAEEGKRGSKIVKELIAKCASGWR